MASTSTTPGNTSSNGTAAGHTNTVGGDTHETQSTSTYNSDGQLTSKSYKTIDVDGDTGIKTETGSNTTYGKSGEQSSKTIYSDVYHEKEGLVSSVTLHRDSQGGTTRIEIASDGTTKTTKTDKEGNVTEETTTDANGNPIEENEPSKFWDIELIYGKPDAEGKIGYEEFNMHTEMAFEPENYVDHFDFIM